MLVTPTPCMSRECRGVWPKAVGRVVRTAREGAIRYFFAGRIGWKLVVGIAVFSIIGSWLGAMLSLKLSPAVIKKIYAVFLLGLALKLFFDK